MPAPINYTQGFTNPMDSIQQTLQIGGMLGQLGQLRDQREAAQQAAIAKAQRDQEIEEAFNAARENPTYENYRRLADMSPPEQAKSFRESWDMLDQAQQRQALNVTVSIYAGFQSGAPDIALGMIEKRVEAAKRAGDAESAKRYQSMLDLAQSGPEGVKAVKDMFGMSIAGMTGGKDAMDALAKFGEEKRSAEAEITKIATELKAAEKTGGLKPTEIIDKEIQLNNTVNTRMAASREARTSYENIKAGAATGDGVGDLAIINTFMRLLSPGIVTAEDYNAATKSGGLFDELRVAGEKIASGDLLSPQNRERYVKLSKQFMENAMAQNEEQLTGIRSIVKTYGLNEDNVFGSAKETAPQAAAGTTAAPASIADIGDLKRYIKSIRPASEHAEIDALDEAGLRREFPKSVASYKPAGAPAAAAVTVPQAVVEADF